MGVLPPRSAHALPKCLADLMTDTSSEIADFYPTDFAIDLNGKTPPNPDPDSEPKPKPKPNPSLNPNPNPTPNPHPNPNLGTDPRHYPSPGKKFAWQAVVLLPFIDEARCNPMRWPCNPT